MNKYQRIESRKNIQPFGLGYLPPPSETEYIKFDLPPFPFEEEKIIEKPEVTEISVENTQQQNIDYKNDYNCICIHNINTCDDKYEVIDILNKKIGDYPIHFIYITENLMFAFISFFIKDHLIEFRDKLNKFAHKSMIWESTVMN